MNSTFNQPRTSVRVITGLNIWFVLAVVLGASGILARVPVPGPQVVLIVLTGALLVMIKRTASLREWVMRVSPRVFVVVHLSRLVGIYFLVLGARGNCRRLSPCRLVGGILRRRRRRS